MLMETEETKKPIKRQEISTTTFHRILTCSWKSRPSIYVRTSHLLRIIDAPVGDNVRCFFLRHIWNFLSSLQDGRRRITYLGSLGSLRHAPRLDPCVIGYEWLKRVRGYDHQQACGRPHQRRGHSLLGRSELDWSGVQQR